MVMWGLCSILTLILIPAAMGDDQALVTTPTPGYEDSREHQIRMAPRWSAICKLGESVCRDVCYSPATQECINDQVRCKNKETVACGETCLSRNSTNVCPTLVPNCKHRCVKTCYYPFAGESCNFANGVEFVCPAGTAACGDVCYAPADKKVCIDDKTLCAVGQSVCGDLCYNPSTAATGARACGEKCNAPADNKVCINNEALCAVGEAACGSRCYNAPVDKKVCIDNVTLCAGGQSACGSLCYNPVTAAVGAKACGEKCSSPADKKVCFNDETLCAVGQAACGSLCYNPSTSNCHKDLDKDSREPTLCPISHKYCNFNCYNPATHDCLQVPHVHKRICFKGQVICGLDCFQPGSKSSQCLKGVHRDVVCKSGEALCRHVCFKPGRLQCLKGIGQDILCKSGEVLCGHTCYNSKDKYCNEVYVVCPHEEIQCGDTCYNPKSHLCFTK